MPLEHIKKTLDQVVQDALTALGIRPISPPTNADIDDSCCETGVRHLRFRALPTDLAIRPWIVERPKACHGCANWHGVRYHDVLLVCGIHPSGVESEVCGDWERQELHEPVE